jgi:hypothetical protein
MNPILPFYLLALAGALGFLNTRTRRQPGKAISFYGMWVALAASAITAWQVFS